MIKNNQKSALPILSLIIGIGAAVFGLTAYHIINIQQAMFSFILLLVLIIVLDWSKKPIIESMNSIEINVNRLETKINKISEIKEECKEIKKDLKNIWQKLYHHEGKIQGLSALYGKSKSPMRPNEKGEKLLKESGFYKIYPKLKTKLFTLMDSWSLRTLYDYEKSAEKALGELKNDPLIDPLKDYVVNHPEESLELIFMVASWVIRDDYNNYKGPQKTSKNSNKTSLFN